MVDIDHKVVALPSAERRTAVKKVSVMFSCIRGSKKTVHRRDEKFANASEAYVKLQQARRGAGIELGNLTMMLDRVQRDLDQGGLPGRRQMVKLREETAAIGAASSHPKWDAAYRQLCGPLAHEALGQLVQDMRELVFSEQQRR